MPRRECESAIAQFDDLLDQVKTINTALDDSTADDTLDTQVIDISLAERALRHGG